MKICLIIHSLGIGGMERVMSLLAGHFADHKKADVHLLLIGRARTIDYELSDAVTVHLPEFKFDNKKRFFHSVRTMTFIRQTVKSLDPDTVLSFGEIWNNLVILSLLGKDVNLYVSDRCKPDKSIGKWNDLLRKHLYKKARGIVAQTEYAKKFFYDETGHSNIEVIGNPIHFIESGNNEKNKEILTVGRLISTKHHDRLIRLFLDIKLPGWKLVIVGGDAQKQNNEKKLKQLINDVSASDDVHLEGEQKSVKKYYRKASVFAFTSSSEGFPNVIGEALSAGLPVVAYDCISGPSDLIEHGRNGYLVDVFDDKTFKEHLLSLMVNDELRNEMSKAAIQSIKTYNPDKIGDKFYQFITSHL
jgi:glycosyltransferase involved in cell wall biosynthesis